MRIIQKEVESCAEIGSTRQAQETRGGEALGSDGGGGGGAGGGCGGCEGDDVGLLVSVERSLLQQQNHSLQQQEDSLRATSWQDKGVDGDGASDAYQGRAAAGARTSVRVPPLRLPVSPPSPEKQAQTSQDKRPMDGTPGGKREVRAGEGGACTEHQTAAAASSRDAMRPAAASAAPPDAHSVAALPQPTGSPQPPPVSPKPPRAALHDLPLVHACDPPCSPTSPSATCIEPSTHRQSPVASSAALTQERKRECMRTGGGLVEEGGASGGGRDGDADDVAVEKRGMQVSRQEGRSTDAEPQGGKGSGDERAGTEPEPGSRGNEGGGLLKPQLKEAKRQIEALGSHSVGSSLKQIVAKPGQ